MARLSKGLIQILLFGAALAPQALNGAPSWEPGHWYTIQVVVIGSRLAVFASDDGTLFFKTHDLELPSPLLDGNLCFLHEEKGNAHGTHFDNIRIWKLDGDGAFDLAEYVSSDSRQGTPTLGKPALSEDFTTRIASKHFVPVAGSWTARNRYLECTGGTDAWPRIRTKGVFRDFFLQFRLYRPPLSSTNWAGVSFQSS